MTKVKVINTVNAPGGIVLKEGQETEIPHNIAEELARAGYVAIIVKGKKAEPKKAAEPVVKTKTVRIQKTTSRKNLAPALEKAIIDEEIEKE